MKSVTYELKISHGVIIALQVLLPVVWLVFNMQWARHVWVGLMVMLVILTFFTLVVRSIVLQRLQNMLPKEREKWKFGNGQFSWTKQIFYVPLNLAFAYVMVVYAQHPFIGALIIVAYSATIYESLFNNN